MPPSSTVLEMSQALRSMINDHVELMTTVLLRRIDMDVDILDSLDRDLVIDSSCPGYYELMDHIQRCKDIGGHWRAQLQHMRQVLDDIRSRPAEVGDRDRIRQLTRQFLGYHFDEHRQCPPPKADLVRRLAALHSSSRALTGQTWLQQITGDLQQRLAQVTTLDGVIFIPSLGIPN